MRGLKSAVMSAAVIWLLNPGPAAACGGFFCGRQPVDQSVERVVFALDQDSTTMIVQIGYMGNAADFAWVLPMSEVPALDSLATFPQRALTALDANTGPVFWGGCFATDLTLAGGFSGSPEAEADGAVTVHIQAQVGPYDAAVIESEDPTALVEWLRAENYRIAPSMDPYIHAYAAAGLKFLALKLQPGRDVSDIEPFRFTIPDPNPVIPLRLTAIAAEPEMSILAMILSDRRYGPRNWPEVTIDESQLVMDPERFGRTNYSALVAKAVDAAGGQGFVVQRAGSSAPIIQRLMATPTATPEDQEARDALLALFDDRPYFTRLYTRLSAEEMTSDPVFGPSPGGDFDGVYEVPTGRACELPSPCEFVTCGQGGLCREVQDATVRSGRVAGCACVPGATARTTMAPDGEATVICQDMRMSFLNPGDGAGGAEPLADPCDGFDCGAFGSCVAVNMTPTCVCDRGLVAVGSVDATQGLRRTRCAVPMVSVEDEFYDRSLPDPPVELPGGRDMPDMMPGERPSDSDLAQEGMQPPAEGGNEGEGGAGAGSGSVGGTGAPAAGSMAAAAPDGSAGTSDGGGEEQETPTGSSSAFPCSVGHVGHRGPPLAGLVLLGLFVALRVRRGRRA